MTQNDEIKINLNYENAHDLLIEASQDGRPCTILLILDYGNRTIYAETRDPITVGITFYEYRGHQDAIVMPYHTDATKLGAWVEGAVLGVVRPLFDAYTSKWDGNNQIASFGTLMHERLEILEWLTHIVNAVPQHDGGMWDVEDWLDVDPDEVGISAESTDEEIRSIARKVSNEALDENVVLIDNRDEVYQYLIEMRDFLEEEK